MLTRLFIEVYDPDDIAKLTIHFACTNIVSLQVWLKSMQTKSYDDADANAIQKKTTTKTYTHPTPSEVGGGGINIYVV